MFYIIRGEAYRSKGNTENPIEIYEEFKDDNPIIAREKSFRFYQNFVDVFLDSKEKSYISHEQVEIDLQDFFNSYKKEQSIWGEIDPDIGVSIQISIVHDDTIVHTFKSGMRVYEGEEVIHGIDKNNDASKENYFKNLIFEYSLYKKNGYEMKNFKKGYNVAGLFEDKVVEYILATPIDFNKVLNDRF
jgi:hypothetical protein